MKIVITLGNKVLSIKDKNLVNKFAEFFNSPAENVKYENNFIPVKNFDSSVKSENKQTENFQSNIPGSAGKEIDPQANKAEEYSSVVNFITAAGETAEKNYYSEISIHKNPIPGQQSVGNNYQQQEVASFIKTNQETSKANSKTEDSFTRLISKMDKDILSFTESSENSFKKMWDGLISNGRKAKDPWDAVWLSLRNSAIKRISEILKTELFNDLFSNIAGGGGSKGFLGSIISGIAGLFSGGILGKTNSVNYAPVSSPAVNAFNNYNSFSGNNRELVNTFTKYAEAADKWQRELRVVNDLFENNRGIKTVQEYLNKIKS